MKIFDCRTPDPHQTWKLPGEVETVTWNPQNPFEFYAGTDNGILACFDCRQGLYDDAIVLAYNYDYV